jgi:hypothetical protein
MPFPFLQSPDPYVIDECLAKLKKPATLNTLTPWIMATSNCQPKGETAQYTISSMSYPNILGKSGHYELEVPATNPKLRPNPIITGFSVDFTARGTLRKGTLKFQCFSIPQLEKLQKYFSEPGISVFVQWGWEKVTTTGERVIPEGIDAATQKKYYRESENLNAIRARWKGCYDNMLGIVVNGKTTVENSTFTLECKIISVAEVMMGGSSAEPAESKKLPSIVPYGEDWLKKRRQPSGGKHLFHWGAFYNSLPDGIKCIEGIKTFGETTTLIDSRIAFINYDQAAFNDIKDEMDGGWTDNFTFLGKKMKGQDDSAPISTKKYVKFSAVIAIYNYVLGVKQEVKTPNIQGGSVGIDIWSSYCSSFKSIFSIDESVFIPNKDAYNWFNDNPYFREFEPKGDSPTDKLLFDNAIRNEVYVSFPTEKDLVLTYDGKKYSFKAGTIGWIGNLYIDHDLAMRFLESSLTQPVKDCLDSLLEEMEKATDGLWDFQVIDNAAGKKDDKNFLLSIVDSRMTNNVSGGGGVVATPAKLQLYGDDCFFTSFNFDFDIPKGLGSKLFMKKSVQGYDGKNSQEPGEKGLFTDSIDVIFKDYIEKPAPAAPNSTQTTSDTEDDKKARWIGFRESAKIIFQPSLTKKYSGGWGNGVGISFNDELIPGVSSNKEAFINIRQNGVANVEGGTTNNRPKDFVVSGSPLAIKISFEVLGVSGFKVGDLLKIENLPEQYTVGSGAFMVLKIGHSIEDSGWRTTVEAMYKPY